MNDDGRGPRLEASGTSLELDGRGLDLVAESFLLGDVANVEVVGTLQHADRAVDQLTDDVRMARVALRVGSDVHQDVVQRDGSVAPPRHLPDGIQGEVADRRVREVPGVSVAIDDVLAGLLGGSPELGGRPCIAREPRSRRVTGSPEHLAEVPEVRGRAVLDQAKQVRARRS